jgi:signal transduction histidine kinase
MPFIRYKAAGNFLPRPVLFTLLLGILLPTACVLWFMTQAMNNEQLAIQQKLLDLYREQLKVLTQDFKNQWQSDISHIEDMASHTDASALFAEVARRKLASAVLVYGKDNELRYPALAKTSYQPTSTPKWARATRLEFQQGDIKAAIEAYRAIATESRNPRMAALALVALARCQSKVNDTRSAIETLTVELADPRFAQATDAQGRLIQISAQLRALELMQGQWATSQDKRFSALFAQLSNRLNSYPAQNEMQMASNQRVFLIHQLQSRWPNRTSFPTLNSEALALDFLSTLDASHRIERIATLSPTALRDTWRLSSANYPLEMLYTKTHLQSVLRTLAQGKFAESGVLLLPPADDIKADSIVASMPIGGVMPGWRIALSAKEDLLLKTEAKAQISLYFWTGILITASIVLLSIITASYLNRQIKQNRLKNDLIATVSHELKTPLSSMRLFVDTLLEEQSDKEASATTNTREYLKLIHKENLRLSRLIDNFLTFSRMERGKQPFFMQPCQIDALVHAALEAVREKLDASGFEVTTDITPNLPLIDADADFMLMALINLIDNAYKYSGDSKRIRIGAHCRGRHICIEVQDWGIGLRRRDYKKIFNRFYRVDQFLSRETDGCGLGLNIVDFIVKAHSGKIEVESELNKGSLFRLYLPTVEAC